MGVKRKESGSVQNKNCYYEANGYTGCGVKGGESTYGPEFNSKGGGVSHESPNIHIDSIQTCGKLVLIIATLRSMQWNFATPAFAYGNGFARISHPT